MSLYPSPSFLSKNQLAKEGPDSVAPVVIPALAPTLDKSLKGDRSLCPVRALHYYLDRTSDLRQNKELIFVSFKKGFDKGISPATTSSWNKQTVILCYELSDQEALTLTLTLILSVPGGTQGSNILLPLLPICGCTACQIPCAPASTVSLHRHHSSPSCFHCVRLKPMMSGPLLPLRPSSRGSPYSRSCINAIKLQI